MNRYINRNTARKLGWGVILAGGLLLLWGLLIAPYIAPRLAYAEPITPPEGYPKLSLSTKTVSPTLALTGGVTLHYTIEIYNTGAYTATEVQLTDMLPHHTTYNDDAATNISATLAVSGGNLTWEGDVGFDSTAVVSFSVAVSPTFIGTVSNTAIISQALIPQPLTKTVETVVTDKPILELAKIAAPPKPGANQPLSYTIVLTNFGQPAYDLLVTLSDRVPPSTTLHSIGVDAVTSPISDVITWTRRVTLEMNDTTAFTFSVNVDDVPSGTVISNVDYSVGTTETGVITGTSYTVTIIDPIFLLHKQVYPDPLGSNRDLAYTLTLLNNGSRATDLVITDRVPAGITYQDGGVENSGVVSWSLATLDTGETADFTYTASISDIMDIDVVNDDYVVCSAEDVCQSGKVLTSHVEGATFEIDIELDPIAKKPGGGGGPVTPTIVITNTGPGNAVAAHVLLEFMRISVSDRDLYSEPDIGTISPGPGCGEKCVAFVWTGDLGYGEAITFTTIEGRNTIGGDEGTLYTATATITDDLSNTTTEPVTKAVDGLVTHYAHLNLSKSAPSVIARGQLLTYTLNIWNSGLNNGAPAWLYDVIPLSTTLFSISDDGVLGTLSDSDIVSWTLSPLGSGERVNRSFTVRVADNLVSGTKIVNHDYRVSWNEEGVTEIFSDTGQPITTTVQEIGLIDSYKEVSPTLTKPGADNVLTYYLHIVNSSPISLAGVTAYDLLPWQSSTYQRDAVASAGRVTSDIVSIEWRGNVGAFSSETVTFTVLVDPDYQGTVTNTATLSHTDLLTEVEVAAVAYVAAAPVLRLSKSASPDSVEQDAELRYTLRVRNLGWQATELVVTDTLPGNTEYIADSATAGGTFDDTENQVYWEFPVLKAGETRTFEFEVTVGSGREVINDQYRVTCAEEVTATGAPVITSIADGGYWIYLPVILKNYP